MKRESDIASVNEGGAAGGSQGLQVAPVAVNCLSRGADAFDPPEWARLTGRPLRSLPQGESPNSRVPATLPLRYSSSQLSSVPVSPVTLVFLLWGLLSQQSVVMTADISYRTAGAYTVSDGGQRRSATISSDSQRQSGARARQRSAMVSDSDTTAAVTVWVR